jgi:UDP-N-acetylglucosamine diphosphorylase/glucosamine-1-phosphate N-acetyltransferase
MRENFHPLSLTRPTFDFLLGTATLLERIQNGLGMNVTDAVVPRYLEKTTREKHQQLLVNEDITERCIAVNALVSGGLDLKSLVKQYWKEASDLVLYDPVTRLPVFAILQQLNKRELARIGSKASRKPGTRQVVTPPSTRSLIRYPWNLIEENFQAISADFKTKHRRTKSASAQKVAARGSEILGSKLMVGENCDIGRFVTLDTRRGPIMIEADSEIQSQSHITGPCYIGKGSVVKSGRIRAGTSIGDDCRISGEVEETIMFEHSNKNHEGFIGHSIVGSWVNLGALTSTSDLKSSYGNIKAKIGGKTVNTESIKVGAVIGDMAKTAIGTMIYSGKKIGDSSHIFGTVVDDVPSFTIYGKSLGSESKEMYFESAVETQRKMMARRNLQLSASQLELMKVIFEMTAKDRLTGNVRRGKFELGS